MFLPLYSTGFSRNKNHKIASTGEIDTFLLPGGRTRYTWEQQLAELAERLKNGTPRDPEAKAAAAEAYRRSLEDSYLGKATAHARAGRGSGKAKAGTAALAVTAAASQTQSPPETAPKRTIRRRKVPRSAGAPDPEEFGPPLPFPT